MSVKYGDRYKEIGIKIGKYRRDRKMTQENLANAVGVSYGYITQIEAPNCVKKMSLEVLFDIAEVLKIDIKDLL